MVTFITLVKDTDRARQEIGDTVRRGKKFVELAESKGVKVKNIYWTQGRYDGIAILEAPDDDAVSALILSYNGVRSETFRAYTADEMEKLLAKVV